MAAAQTPEARDPDLPRQRAEWFYRQRAYPLGFIPAGARLEALQQVDRMVESQAAPAQAPAPGVAASASQWTLIGPQGSNSPFYTRTAGRVSAMAVDPRNANVVYLGAAQGGLWKTADGGLNWTPLTDAQASLAIGSIALDPSNPDTVYVGTGEENFGSDSYYGAGILKSTDGGRTWTNLGRSTFAGPLGGFTGGARIGSLAVHPTNGQVLLAGVQVFSTGSSAGIYRSTDAGTTWSNVLSGAAGTEVIFDPTNGNIAYAALGFTEGISANGVYKSSDGGATWSRINGTGSNVLPSTNVGRIEIAIAPSSPTTLYAGIQNSATVGSLLGFFKTTDGGQNWMPLSGTPDFCTPQCWYDLVVRVSPVNANVVFAGGSDTQNGTLIRSTDGGATWADLTRGANGERLHPDHHALAFSTAAAKLYVGNDGGVWSTTDVASAAVSWTNLNATLAITQFYPGHSIHPTNVNFGFGGSQDTGTQRYAGLLPWDWVTCGDGGWTAIDFATPSTVYAACQRIDVRKSTANGDLGTFSPAKMGIDTNDRREFIPPLVMDPSNSRTLYFGTYRVYQTSDGAASWAAISPDLTTGCTDNFCVISTLAVAPNDSNTVYAGTLDSKVQVTGNAAAGAGAAWTDRSAGLPGRSITQIAVDPGNAQVAYVTFSGFSGFGDSVGHVLKTTNGGASWTDLGGNLPNIPVNDIVVDPDMANTLYVATDVGVFWTNSGGSSWALLGSGLPRVAVLGLKLHRASRTLRAATHGRSMWDLLVPLSGSNPVPALNSLSPSSATAGTTGFMLTLNGSGFVSSSVVRWNGSDRSTTFRSSSQLTASVNSSDIASAGTAQVTVFNPAPGGGVSNALAFTINPASTIVLNSRTMTKAVNGCTTPAPATTFLSTDTQAFVWFNVSGAQVGDRPTAEWYFPSGQLYRSDAWDPNIITKPGGYCFFDPLAIAGQPPASSPGDWTVKVYWNGSLLFSLTFTINRVVNLPDLVPTSFTAPNRGTIGGRIWMELRIRNIGTANAGAFRAGFYYSTRSTVTTQDAYSGWFCRFDNGLAAGSDASCQGEIGVPSSLTPGTYSVGVIVDDQNQVQEADKTNNTRVSDTGPISLSVPGSFEPQLTRFLTPGFYILEATLAPGAPAGFWGLEVLTSLGQAAGGFNLGGGLYARATNPSFGAFLLSTPQTVTATLNAQLSSGGSLTLRLLDSNKNQIGDPVTGPPPLTLSRSLAPGFYIVEAYSSAPTRVTYQLGLAADFFSGGVDTGGYLAAGFTGFGAFYVPEPQNVTMKLFGQNKYGATGAGDLILTLKDANRNVLQVVGP